jgi:hypothetical protein
MPTPEGRGIARSRWRKAWDAYARAVNKVALPALEPVIDPAARKIAGVMTTEAVGFWLMWHLEGGFEGLQRLGMSRSGIYRRIKYFRRIMGAHPDEFEFPGVSLDLEAYLHADLGDGKGIGIIGPRKTHPSLTPED